MLFDIEKIDNYTTLDVLARQVVEGFLHGLHKSPYHGASVEYAEHRIYNPGDPIKDVDWKIYAKTDRLYVKRYEEESNLRAYMVLDASASMYYPPKDQANGLGKIRFACFAAATLNYLLHKQRDATGLFVFSEQIDYAQEAKISQVYRRKLLSELSALPMRPPVHKGTNTPSVLHEIANRIPPRAMVVVLSDLLSPQVDELILALEHLVHKRHEVLLFHIRDYASEVLFNFKAGSYLFEGLEDGEKIKLNPQDMQALYQEKIKQHEDNLYRRCGSLGAQFFSLNIAEPFDMLLLACLKKRIQMG